jgi:hypothetical protein
VIGRWTARIAGTLMALFFLAFFVGEGFPNIFRLHWRESLSVLALSAVIVGLLLAWIWEGLGGAVAVVGMAVFMLLIGSWGAASGLLLVPAAIGVLHVVCWWRLRSATGVGWEVPRKVLIVVGLAVGVFILLCANEMFGMPPLMTPAFHPPPDMVGTWEAKLPTMDAVFTIHPDASVSGRIGDAAVVNARIGYNRSWFGRLMHWRSDGYLMLGRLSRGDQFTAGLMKRGVGLEGTLCLSQKQLGLRLRKQ